MPRPPAPDTAATQLRMTGSGPRHSHVDSASLVLGLGLGITLGLAVISESSSALHSAGGIFTALGQLAGLVAGYLLMMTVLLISRIPFVERTLGQDRLVRWHRWLGPIPITLIVFHVWLITLGYAQSAHRGFLSQFWTFLRSYPDMIIATIAVILFLTIGFSSARAARRRMPYERWWLIHLSTYLALVLSFPHQIATGPSFVGHPIATAWWIALWFGTAGVVLVCRIGLPIWRSLRHQLHVVEVIEETPGVVSVVVAGRRLDRIPVDGGQFFHWRILKPGWWWQAHPYSISALPSDNRMRVTIKNLGDHSAEVAQLTPGTRMAIEGPYGNFTKHSRQRERVLLIAAGVGTSPIRSLVEDFPAGLDTVVILRGRTIEEIPLRAEFLRLADHKRIRVLDAVGSRQEMVLDASTLRAALPDIAERDVYICGPMPFTKSISEQLQLAGVPDTHIYHELFGF